MKTPSLGGLRAEGHFKGLKPGEADEIVADMIADSAMSDEEIALQLAAKEFGIGSDSFDRHRAGIHSVQ